MRQNPANTLLTKVLKSCQRHRWPISGAAIFLTLICAASIPFLKTGTDLDLSLPAGSGVQEALRFLDEHSLANSIVIEVTARGQTDDHELLTALDHLRRGLENPLISRVVIPEIGPEKAAAFRLLAEHGPLLLTPEDYEEIGELVEAKGVDRRLREERQRMMKPMGLFASDSVRDDPLGLQGIVWQKLLRLTAAADYAAVITDGHFLNADASAGLVIAEAEASISSPEGSLALVTFLEQLTADVPGDFDVRFFCGHRHTVSNQAMAIRDIQVVSIAAGAAFLLLLFFVFRDSRVLLVFLSPLAACCIAIAVCGVVFNGLSLMIIGLSCAFAGMAVDYGIHTYVAVRCGQDRATSIANVSGRVIAAACTTSGVFLVLLFSAMPYFRQMGLLALVILGVSQLCALFLLPAHIPAARPFPTTPLGAIIPPGGRWRPRPILVIALFVAALVSAVTLAVRTPFDASLTQLDGTPASLIEAEKKFSATWSSGDGQAMIAVSSESLDDVLSRNRDLQQALSSAGGSPSFTGVASLLPPAAVRANHATVWSKFWDTERTGALERNLSTSGARYGFKRDAFEPFFATVQKTPEDLTTHQQLEILNAFGERFFRQTSSGYFIFTYLPDAPDTLPAIRAAVTGIPGAQLISRNAIAGELAQAITSETLHVCVAAVIVVCLLALVCCRSVSTALLSLLPAILGMSAAAAVPGLLGRTLNVANVLGAVIVLGLCVDYGIYMTHSYRSQSDIAITRKAVGMCALTTLCGVGALIVAQHPCLQSLGITVVTGVIAGFLVSVFVIPACFQLRCRFRPARDPMLLLLMLLLAPLLFCQTSCKILAPPKAPVASDDSRAGLAKIGGGYGGFDSVSLTSFQRGDTALTSLGLLSLSPEKQTFTLSLMQPTGIARLLELDYANGRARCRHAVTPPGAPPGAGKAMAKIIGKDIAQIHFHLTDNLQGPLEKDTHLVYFRQSKEGRIEYEVDSETGHLIGKRLFEGDRVCWQIHYGQYTDFEGKNYPSRIAVENFDHPYSISVLVKTVTPR